MSKPSGDEHLGGLTEAVPGGWGIAGHAYSNEEIGAHVRKLPGTG